MRLLSFLFLLALTLSAPVSQAFAVSVAVGSVKQLKGSAVAIRGNQEIPLMLGDPIFEGDLIKTGKRSSLYAAMQGDEKNAIRMGQKSQLEVQSYKVSSGNVFGGFLKALVGIFTVELNNLRKGGDFTMKTPTAVLGVRGTVWGSIVKSDGSTSFSVLRGSVSVQMGGRTISLAQGQTVSVNNEGLVSPVVPTPKEIQENLESDGSTFDNAAAEAAALAAAEEAAKEAVLELAAAAEEAMKAAEAAEAAAAEAAANPGNQTLAQRAQELQAIADAAAENVVDAAVLATTTEQIQTQASAMLNFAQTGTASVDIPASFMSSTGTATEATASLSSTSTSTGSTSTITTTTTTIPSSTTTGGGAPASPA